MHLSSRLVKTSSKEALILLKLFPCLKIKILHPNFHRQKITNSKEKAISIVIVNMCSLVKNFLR